MCNFIFTSAAVKGADRMGKIILVASGKGGTGKTTTAANLGAALSKRGHMVALVDMDIGLRNLDIALGLESAIVYDALDAVDGRCSFEDVLIKHSQYENLYFIAAPQTRDIGEVDEDKLGSFWERVESRFDYCLIDAPAGIVGGGFDYALSGAKSAVIVTLAELTALRDADRAISVIEDKGIEEIKLVVNRIRPEMIDKGIMMNVDECMDILSIPMLGIVPEDEELVSSALKSTLAIENENSMAGKAYLNIANRICGESIPILDMEKRPSIYKRLFTRRK